MNRSHWILTALLVLQLLLILLLRSPFSDAATGSGGARDLLPTLENLNATKIALSGDEQSVELVRQDDQWRIDALGGFPADGDKVDKLLEDLEGLRVRVPVVTSDRYHDTLQIADDDNSGRVRVWGAEGGDAPEIDLVLGSSPTYRVLHVRHADEDAVFETRGFSAADARPDSAAWIRTSIVEATPEELTALTLENESGRIELLRDATGWTLVGVPDGKQLDPTKVDSLLRTATGLRFASAVGPLDETAHGFGSPSMTLTLGWLPGGFVPSAEGESSTTEPAQTLTVRVGSSLADEDSKRYITRSEFGFTGSIWNGSVQSMLDQQVDDLLVDLAAEGA